MFNCTSLAEFPSAFLFQLKLFGRLDLAFHLDSFTTTVFYLHYLQYSHHATHNTSHRSVAMVMALVVSIVLSPLYVVRRSRNEQRRYYETKLDSGFVLPLLIAGLIIAIRTTSGSSLSTRRYSLLPSPDPCWVLRIGSSSWGLGGLLILLLLVLSWQDSLQDFFWR